MEILCIGSITKDIFFPTSEGTILNTPDDILSQKKIAFELGAKYHIAHRAETLGGCAVNVACGLSRLGQQARCMAVIGNDSTGGWFREELIKQGVEVTDLVEINGIMSDLSAIVVDSNSGERTIFSSHSASSCLKINKEEIKETDWVFVGDLSGSWESNLQEIIMAAQENKIKVAFNPRQKTIAENTEVIIEALEKCAFFIVNKDEAIELISSLGEEFSTEELENEIFLLDQLKNRCDGIVAITDGLRGAWANDGESSLHVEAIPQEAVDTTGAGDAFTSGFFAAHIQGYDLETCLRWGIANSSSSVTEYGGQAGLLDEGKIKNMAEEVALN